MNKTLILTGWSKTVYMTAAALAALKVDSAVASRENIYRRLILSCLATT